jgi:ribonuclease HI
MPYYGIYALRDRSLSRVCTSWDDAKELMAGVTRVTGAGALVKKFVNVSHAEYFAQHGRELPPLVLTASSSSLSSSSSSQTQVDEPLDEQPPKHHAVYTDGSMLQDGKRKAAGYGVYFGPEHPLNVSAALGGDLQTNNRAEITAILEALTILANADNRPHFRDTEHLPVVIYTDSDYSVGSCLRWREAWERPPRFRNNTIMNRDLIEALWNALDTFHTRTGRHVMLQWTKAHCGNPGNDAADALANDAATRSLRTTFLTK